MSDQWPDLIQKYKALVELHKDKLALDIIFERVIMCYVDRSVLYAATKLDHRMRVESGHEHLDNIYRDTYAMVILSIDDLIEIESTSPTTDEYNPVFNFAQTHVHYIPWVFDVIRNHVSIIAKNIYDKPTTPVPVEDLTKMELLLRRLSKITIEFRVNMGTTKNLNSMMSLITGMENVGNSNERLRNEIEQTVYEECDIIRQLVNTGKLRQNIDNRKMSMDGAISEIDRINRTFRWQ